MTASTLSSVATALWSDLSAMGSRIETDMKTLTNALCLSNDPSGLQTLFDAAYADAAAADKTARGAITGRFNLLAKRAHYWANIAGFVLSMPRLDGKGDCKAPTVTPKETAKLTAQGAAAERAANADKALAEMVERNATRAADAVRALTPSDIANSVLGLCEGADVHPLEVILSLIDSLKDPAVFTLADTLNMLRAYRNGSADAPAPVVPADKASFAPAVDASKAA